jgi:hypothetical protein
VKSLFEAQRDLSFSAMPQNDLFQENKRLRNTIKELEQDNKKCKSDFQVIILIFSLLYDTR